MKNRCEGCEFAKRISAQMGNWSFIGCTYKPYDGKWIAEIEDCPKEVKEKDDRDKNIL